MSTGPLSTSPAKRVFYLLRHATTVANDRNVYPSDDTPLAPEGETQARAAAPWFRGRRFDRVFVSPLLRARDTALLLGVQGETVPALRDHDMGVYTGRPFGSYQLFCSAWNIPIDEFVPEGGESYAQARERVTTWLASVPKEGVFLVIAHSDTLHWIVEALTGNCPHHFENVALWTVEDTALVHENWKPWIAT
jgi:broad specificity phosphatase PhoE